jgi:carbonic anhydrase/acetyltransferase-like protein (isoleucine patch superfamily)
MEQKIYSYKDLSPKIHKTVFIAPGAKIIGDVEIGEYSSIWYNSVVRGDVHYIKIGSHTNIQDCSMLHVTNGKYPLNIGNNVTVGHSVNLHGCTINNLCLIGIGSIVLDGAVIENKSMVAAGSVVRPGFIVPSGKLVAGVPAEIVRELNNFEIAELINGSKRYVEYSKIMSGSLKSSGKLSPGN